MGKIQQAIFISTLIILFTISTSIVHAAVGCVNGPSVISVTTTHTDGTFNESEIIDINANYNASVNVSTAGGTPYIALNSGGAANYLSGTNSQNLTFRYTVASSQSTNDLDYSTTSSLNTNNGTIANAISGGCTLGALPALGTFAAAHAIIIESRHGPRGQPTQAYMHQKIPT